LRNSKVTLDPKKCRRNFPNSFVSDLQILQVRYPSGNHLVSKYTVDIFLLHDHKKNLNKIYLMKPKERMEQEKSEDTLIHSSDLKTERL
jgi:hypothetical protein